MNHEGHILVGLIVAAIAMLALNAFTVQLIAIAVLGAILPDIDLKQSKISKILKPIAVLGSAFLIQPLLASQGTLFSWVASLVAGYIAISLILIPVRRKHRGVTHTFTAAIVFAIICAFASGVNSGVIALFSYGSHLVVDGL